MKKILLMALAAATVVGCSQNEEVENAAKSKEMKFSTAVMRTTRAGVITNTEFDNFNLYAISGTKVIIDDVAFTRVGQDWTAFENAKFYWPNDENVSFYGYSAETIGDVTFAKETPALTYTVKTTLVEQEDLLVASITTNQGASAAGVNLAFTHVLSKMSFKVKGEGSSAMSYTVSKIEISAKPKGTYTYSDSKWIPSADAAVTYTLPNPALIAGGSEAEVVDATLMMLPQDGATVTVEYTFTINSTVSDVQTKTLDFPKWEKGSNTAYTLKLDAKNEIIISGAVNPEWDAATPGELN